MSVFRRQKTWNPAGLDLSTSSERVLYTSLWSARPMEPVARLPIDAVLFLIVQLSPVERVYAGRTVWCARRRGRGELGDVTCHTIACT
jgi:hypothetical protein